MEEIKSLPVLGRFEKPLLQIIIILFFALFIWTSVEIIIYPYGVDYGEAPLIDQAIRFQKHLPVYKATIDTPPYIIANYPPLYPLVVAGTHGVFNLPLFATGRIISLISSLISGIIIALLSYSLTRNETLAALAAALFWGNPYVTIWSSLARVDLLALSLSLVAIYILVQCKPAWYWLVLACIFFLASAFTRQSYLLAGPLAGFIWLWHGQRKRALIFAGALGISGLLLFGMINALTQGGFYTNIIVANLNRMELGRIFVMFKQLLIIWPVILIILVVSLIRLLPPINRNTADFTKASGQTAIILFLLLPFTIGSFITSLTIGKVGSDVNYFLELISACCLWVVIFISQLANSKPWMKRVIMGLFALQLIWGLVASYQLSNTVIKERWRNLSFYNGLFQQVRSSAHLGKVLSDDYLDLVVLSGQPIYYQPFEYGQLYQAGLWNPDQFAVEIAQKKFSLILIGGDTIDKKCCWPAPLVDAIQTNYRSEYDDGLIVLTPR